MSTTEKPVVLLVGHDQEYAARLREACEKEGNPVFDTPTLLDLLHQIYPEKEKSRRVVILLGPHAEHPNAILSYVNMAVAHRVIVILIYEDIDGDEEHIVRRWARSPKYRAYNILDRSALWLPGLAFDLNTTPVWDDKRKLLTDTLTGLENSEGFIKNVTPELELMRDRRRRKDGSGDRRTHHMDHMAVLVIDANRLKIINDVFGHFQGDLALQTIAQALRRHVRAAHHVCRKSGDEFIVGLPGYNLEQAERRGLVLTSAIASAPFQGTQGEPWQLSALFGASSIRADQIGEDAGATLRELIDQADKRLISLKAKRNKAEGKDPGER